MLQHDMVNAASDKMWKLKPLLNRLNDNFMEHFIPMQHLNYDESMIAYFGRHGCKQFIRGKPIRFGFKAWCLNTFNGYLVNFDIYQGRKDSAVSKYEKHFGKCAAPMMKMLDKMPQEKKLQYCLYFDNLFTGMNLLHQLKEIGILGTGTIRENRLPKECKIISSKEIKIKKKPREFASIPFKAAIFRENEAGRETTVTHQHHLRKHPNNKRGRCRGCYLRYGKHGLMIDGTTSYIIKPCLP
ncbi:hypothetical protein M8J77_002326 [Diaphorina citri]|nr:hypothetical protein M8J77_002326 [Diaphorina citri]